MDGSEHILISLEARHAENILAGTKQVELRRRTMKIMPGAVIWIYVKLPVGSIVGRAVVKANESLAPAKLWQRHEKTCGLSRKEFFGYFKGVEKGTALILENTMRLQKSLSLESLRELDEFFQPPQFFSRLSMVHPIGEAVTSSA